MFTMGHKSGRVARFFLMLVLAISTFATAATPASAARRSLPPTDLGGKLAVYIFDNSSDAKGPIFEAAVTVYDMSGAVISKGTTNKSGWFSVELEHGKYVVCAVANGYTLSKTTVAVIGGSDVVAKLGLTKEVPLTGTLKLHIWDTSGPAPKPVAGAAITIWNNMGNVVGKGFTGKDGLFTISLTPGTYKMKAIAEGFKPNFELAEVVASQETAADITLIKEAVAFGNMTVRLFDAHSSNIKPVEGASIKVFTMPGQLVTTGTSDSNGKFTASLLAGQYVIEIKARGYQTAKLFAEINPDRDYAATLFLLQEPMR